MYVVYAIKSLSKGRIYFGQTKDLNKRLNLHNAGKVKSTKIDTPWAVIAVETFGTRSEAMWTERKLKKSHEFQNRWLRNRVIDNRCPNEKYVIRRLKMASGPEGGFPRRE